jgi:hypothetical protein
MFSFLKFLFPTLILHLLIAMCISFSVNQYSSGEIDTMNHKYGLWADPKNIGCNDERRLLELAEDINSFGLSY